MNEQQRLTAEPADERLRRILYTAPEAIVGMDGGGFVTAWNETARKMFGWSQDEAVGKVLAELIIPPNLRDAHWAGLRRFLDTGEGPVFGRRLELSALHRDGHEFPVELTISPFETDVSPAESPSTPRELPTSPAPQARRTSPPRVRIRARRPAAMTAS